jgi:hypothetical protein
MARSADPRRHDFSQLPFLYSQIPEEVEAVARAGGRTGQASFQPGRSMRLIYLYRARK